MNDKATAYVLQHGCFLEINGRQELMLPLDRIQGFLDLIKPGDIPPEKVQTLYAMQATLVETIRDAFSPSATDQKTTKA